MTGERLCLIVNPRSAGGATATRMGELRRAADRHFERWDLWTTERQGHATELAARAVAEGYDVIVAVGGDGTANEVANGLFDGDRPRDPRAVFSVIPAGTGSDLVKTLGMPKDVDEALRVVAEQPARPTDATYVELERADGTPVRRIGINITGFGLNGEVVRRANASSKRLGGTITFAVATARTLRAYVCGPVRLTWVDEHGADGRWEGRLWAGFLANGQYCGGGMWMGRGGAMDDGLVDLTIIPELGLPKAVLHAPRLFAGTIGHVKSVSRARIRSLSATALDGASVLVDIDGEQPGVLPLRVSVLPKALLVRGLWPSSPK